MRALIRSAIVNDATLQSLGVVSGAVLAGDIDTPQQRPFVNLRWGGVTPGIGPANRGTLVVWVHDEPGDYEARVNPILLRLRGIITELAAMEHPTGWLVVAEWTGDSDDLSDDGHGTITRNASFNLIGSGQ